MTIGQRIKNRRLELNMSVDEVANKLGKNRATIYRYEKDDIKDLPITVLEPLARVLETTPADLTGWGAATDKKDIPLDIVVDNMSEFSLSEKTHFKKYLKLLEINRKKADLYVDQLLSLQNMENTLAAAHDRTDIDVTEEMKKNDDDIMNDDSEWE